MNAVLQAMKERRSVRAYQDKPVPRDVIERICEAGTYGSGCGSLLRRAGGAGGAGG